MNLERTESPGWLSNAYLIDGGAGTGVLVDGNGVAAPLLDAIDRRGLRVPALLLTHHHADHVVLDEYREFGALVYAHPLTAAELPGVVDTELGDADRLEFGGLSIECPAHAGSRARPHGVSGRRHGRPHRGRPVPRHRRGHPRPAGHRDRRSAPLAQALTGAPPTMRVHPGHREPTTIGEERESNPFVRALLDDERPESVQCTVGGEPAQLLLWGPDYDGTNKAWVRFAADGEEAIVGGSQVQRKV